MSHCDLVKVAARWLKTDRRCPIVVTELVAGGCREIPDAFGLRYCGHQSILVECKVSRADFARDKKKFAKRMGRYQYYLAPKGLLFPDEIPAGWGLIEFDGERVQEIKEAEFRTGDRSEEVSLMYSILLRESGRSPQPEKATVDLAVTAAPTPDVGVGDAR